MEKVSILFVCMGNICRSPTAQGIFTAAVEEAGLSHRVHIDSAGTHAYHVGEPPDPRATRAAAARGIDLSDQRARRVERADFERFDYVLAMDRDNRDALLAMCPAPQRQKVRLFLAHADEGTEQDVPDPYYGGEHGFERVLDLVEEGARRLLDDIRVRLAD